jgi:hypothetical protein
LVWLFLSVYTTVGHSFSLASRFIYLCWMNPCHNPNIKSRCGAQPKSCVCPCIALFGAQMV